MGWTQGLGRHFIVRVLTRKCGMKGVQPIKTTGLLWKLELRRRTIRFTLAHYDIAENLPHRSNATPYRPEKWKKTDTFRPCAPQSPAVSIHTRAKANRSLMKQELNAERVRILNKNGRSQSKGPSQSSSCSSDSDRFEPHTCIEKRRNRPCPFNAPCFYSKYVVDAWEGPTAFSLILAHIAWTHISWSGRNGRHGASCLISRFLAFRTEWHQTYLAKVYSLGDQGGVGHEESLNAGNYEGQSEYVHIDILTESRYLVGKYPSTSAGSIRINAENTNHRGNSTVPCFQQIKSPTTFLSPQTSFAKPLPIEVWFSSSAYYASTAKGWSRFGLGLYALKRWKQFQSHCCTSESQRLRVALTDCV